MRLIPEFCSSAIVGLTTLQDIIVIAYETVLILRVVFLEDKDHVLIVFISGWSRIVPGEL